MSSKFYNMAVLWPALTLLSCKTVGPKNQKRVPWDENTSLIMESPSKSQKSSFRHNLSAQNFVYLPKENIKIKQSTKAKSGSLFSPNDPSSNMILDNMPAGIGSMVTLFVDVARKERKERKDEGDQANKVKELDGKELTDELLSGLPSLEPEKQSDKRVLTRVSAKIVDRKANGDLVLEAQRSSTGLYKSNSVFFRATLPADKLQQSNKARITDLVDVAFREVGDSGIIDRGSTNWEDEYSLRYSGFSEVPSKMAAKIGKDRQDLLSMRKRFENQLKSFKKEREKIAREREESIDRMNKAIEGEKRISGLEKQILEKDKQILALEDQLVNKNEPVDQAENLSAEQGDQ